MQLNHKLSADNSTPNLGPAANRLGSPKGQLENLRGRYYATEQISGCADDPIGVRLLEAFRLGLVGTA